MEYLMTYGWAILIIAVVLGALFQLGVFNSSSFSPRAPPGSCQVFRPGGPRTTTNINLMGVCTGQLPQYVSSYARGTTYSYVTVPYSSVLIPASVTATTWIFSTLPASGGWQNPLTKATGNGNYGYEFTINPTGDFYFNVNNGMAGLGITSSPYTLSPQRWYFAAGSYDSVNGLVYLYINGAPVGSPASAPMGALQDNHQPLYIGSRSTGYGGFNGFLSNVQVYNSTLTANQILALYLEGMGGAPMTLQPLVGWWPLNGNSNEYSGNNNNGVPTNVVFTSQYGK